MWVLLWSMIIPWALFAQESEEKPSKGFVWEPVPLKEFSSEERKKECARYEGRYIGYYDKLFLVVNCKRREILGGEVIRDLMVKEQVKVEDVQAKTMIMLEEGQPYRHLPGKAEVTRSCSELAGKYVVYEASDIFFIEDCKRRLVPDYETYQHRLKTLGGPKMLVELNSREYHKLKEGEPLESIMPDVFKKLMISAKDVDIIPIDEACQGVENKWVTYYSKIYKIESCRKREVLDIPKFLKSPKNSGLLEKELTSEQWVSLPDGEPMDERL